ncbi:hypothetical protein ZOSMA_35G00370 [Zostera marina]|uniref:Uncharacterized protein n=1 Tax=Zostera marina TaxID=29655 RepID=A0A0K9P8K3_ZOSMR|nr:hypothetical protein ZOSMA_35G00370 [Zostera marina]
MLDLVEAAGKLAWVCSKSVIRNTVLTTVGIPDIMGMAGDFTEVIQILSDITTEIGWSTFSDELNKATDSTVVEDLSIYDELIDLANEKEGTEDDVGKNENSSESKKRTWQQLAKILMNQRKLQEKKIAAIVVGSKFINSSDVMDITISKKFMRSELTITGVNNTLKMKVRSDNLISFRHRQTLFDEDDNPIVHINKKVVHTKLYTYIYIHSEKIRPDWIFCDGKLATIRGIWQVFKGGTDDSENLIYKVAKCNMIQFTNEYQVFLAGNTEEEKCDFSIKHVNDARTYSVNIGDSDEIIAQIHEKRNIDAYGVTIYPFVDYAFVISLIAILYVIDD